MRDQDGIIAALQKSAKESSPDNFFINVPTRNKESRSPKKLYVQTVIGHLVESYSIDRNSLEVNNNPQIPGQGRKRIDNTMFRAPVKRNNDNLRRVIVHSSESLMVKI